MRPTTALGPLPPRKRVLRVGDVTRYLQRVVESDELLQELSIMGEVTDLTRPASGHCYFKLKDTGSILSCVMWRMQVQQARGEIEALRSGMSVVVDGGLSIYESRGQYQLNVQAIRIQGEGAAKARFERLRKQLAEEGLFAVEHKRPLPSHPRTLALITSPESDAYHDVIRRLQLQWPRLRVVVAAVQVQGEHSPGEIALALDLVNRMTDSDVVLLVRGGGSDEELAWFNEERVARAIFASRIPVVTGIGHEQDTTIADLVADVRAATPTAAAAIAVPDGPALRKTCRDLEAQLLVHTRRGLSARRQRLTHVERALTRASPSNRVRVRRQRVDELWQRVLEGSRTGVERRRQALIALDRQLSALDPTAILGRGYALVQDADTGQVISSVSQAEPARRVSVRVKDGAFPARVEVP